MGGVRITTGLYDENFFNNPARVTANPENKFTFMQITPAEISSPTPGLISDITKNSDDALAIAANNSGKNIHGRTQIILPAYYLAPKGEERKFGLAFALITSAQADAAIHQSYQTSLDGLVDIGPAVTYGRKFLSDDSLSVGITGHLTYRAGIGPDYSILDYVRGKTLSVNNMVGQGAMLDFDLGSTYLITKLGEFDISAGAAIQNILGGGYSNISYKPLDLTNSAPRQPRSFGFGGSATRGTWGSFTQTTFALEFTDIGNNSNGSIFRLIHMGGETHWKSLAFRLGLNQGYISAGLGLDVQYFTLDLATYGEEMGLNAGTFQDRRYTLNFGFHI
jgi:hypothetical protein